MIKLFHGDSFDMIQNVKDEKVKLVMTDVPYPDMEIHDFEKHVVYFDKWIEWFAPLAKEIERVLQDGGSFVTTINCKIDFSFYYKWVDWMCKNTGLTYVYDWYWVKTRLIPGRMNRPRDCKDYIAHFYKGDLKESKTCYNMQAVDDWKRYNPNFSIPTNMIYATSQDSVCKKVMKEMGMKHNGKYPNLVPELFIKLLTEEGDLILEPFNGTGTTSIEAAKQDRNCIAFEFNENWVELAKRQYDIHGFDYKIYDKK